MSCEPLPYVLNDAEKELIARHRKEQCPDGEPCKIHLVMPVDRYRPDGVQHGCVVCGEPVA